MHAARQAGSLAKALGAAIEVLGVAVIHPMYGGLHLGAVGAEGLETEVEKAAELAVNDTAQVLREEGLEPRTVVVMAMGNAASAIVDEAQEVGADLIVMGSRGLGRAGSLILGSTSVQLLHLTEIPVLMVR
jgi:nucleotide-binding universal stress UspA family protein